jgi:hypothetical protein
VHSSFQLSQVSTTPAEVELRLGIDDKSITIVSAFIRGPFCEYASTLPATIPFRRNQKEAEFFKATVPDPCYWTPLMPHLYRIEVQYRRGEAQTVETARFERGLRRCEIRNSALFIDGERTIIRGISWNEFSSEPSWNDLRATRTSLIVSAFDEEFLLKCSKHGISIFVTATDAQQLTKSVEAAEFPAFCGFIAAGQGNIQSQTATTTYQARVTVATHSTDASARSNHMVFAVSQTKHSQAIDWAEKRKACDALQAEVATIGEFAGYIVL